MTRQDRYGGFTLVELLVAVALFAVVAAMAYPGLTRILASRAQLDDRQARLAALTLGLAVLEQDIVHAAPRPVRDELGDSIAAMRGGIDGVLFECTRRVAPLAGFDDGSGLVRVDYALVGHRLVRREWNVLDRTQASTTHDRTLLDGVDAVAVTFFDGQRWHEFWPPQAGVLDYETLPAGVRLVVTLDGGEQVSRVFALAEYTAGG